MQNVYYLTEEIADTVKMRVWCNPPVKHPLEHKLVAIKEKQKPKLQQTYSRQRRGSSQTTAEDVGKDGGNGEPEKGK